jgi:hypothetical protein
MSREYPPTRTPAITDASRELFIALVEDAGNWHGSPKWCGNVGSAFSRDDLLRLQRAGLLIVDRDAGEEWVFFTLKGREYAASLGLESSGLTLVRS